MKQILIKMLLLFTLIIILKCEKLNDVLYKEDFYGHWILTSSKTNRNIDYNKDSQEINDFECYTIELLFNKHGIFHETRVDKVSFNNSISCIQTDLNGFWSLDKNSLKFTYNNQIFINEMNEVSFIDSRRFNDVNGSFTTNLKLTNTTN
jgi:hypothetical protein